MKTLFAAAVAVTLLTGTVAASASDRDHGRQERRWDDRRHDNRHDDRRGRDWNRHDNHRNDHRDWNRHDDRRHDRHDWNRHNDHRGWDHRDYRAGYWQGRVDQRRFDRGRYIPPRGYYAHSWRRGDRLPRAYCGNSYIVRDYHVYHLSPPPHGHHWVRVNNDVVLAAVTSGLVVSVVNGLFF